jgi:hypothetical protein
MSTPVALILGRHGVGKLAAVFPSPPHTCVPSRFLAAHQPGGARKANVGKAAVLGSEGMSTLPTKAK